MTPLTFNCHYHPGQELDFSFDNVYNRILIDACPECEAEHADDVSSAEADGYDNGRSDGYEQGRDDFDTNDDD